MNLDPPGIVCYEHCALGRLFAFTLPPNCDLCGADLEDAPLAQPPFRVPYPFVRASQVPCCIVIKPTRGDFLHDYRNNSNLHIGVTDSEGRVYEYDFEGLHSDGAASWIQCLAVPIISSNTNDTPDPVWKEYRENFYNCYTFVIKFLRALRPPSFCTKDLCKTSFCDAFIVPVTSSAAKYISVYRSLREREVLPVPRNNTIILRKKEAQNIIRDNAITTSEL
ncbi:MKRN2 opposite strand protein, partial [Armadillidium nasatum]